MKIYRVSIYPEDGSPNQGEHLGYEYFTSRRRAQITQNAINRECRNTAPQMEVKTIEIPGRPTRRMLVQLLNQYGGYPDNG